MLRIILMCIFGLYAVLPLVLLLFAWNKMPDKQKLSYVSFVMLGVAVFYYALKFQSSPRGVWVKIRKVIAYILVAMLYVGVLPTTLQQFTTGSIPGVYGNAWGVILVTNALIYGIFILCIWLLLRQYKRDKYIPYSTYEKIDKQASAPNIATKDDCQATEEDKQTPLPKIETEILEDVHEDVEPIRERFLKNKPAFLLMLRRGWEAILLFLKKTWKWTLGIVLLAALIIAGILLYNYLHDNYIPKKKLDKAVAVILEKFNSEETRTEMAYNILRKDYDWGYDSIQYDGCYGNKYIKDELSEYRSKAFAVIENAAFQGDAKCQYYLGGMYYQGNKYFRFPECPYPYTNAFSKNEEDCDQEKAAYWWNESAQNGYVPAFNKIGICYKKGIGVAKDMYKAIEWLKKGAEAGESMAQKNYGDLYLEGVNIYVGSHYERRPYYDFTGYGVLWYEKVEVSDYKTLIPVDIEQAKYWWKLSAAQGNEKAKARLQKIYE